MKFKLPSLRIPGTKQERLRSLTRRFLVGGAALTLGVASVSFVEAPTVAVAETVPADYTMRITGFANMPFTNNVNQYAFGSSNFTVQSWMYSEGGCGVSACTYMGKENSWIFGVLNGEYAWALQGTNGSWSWISSGVNVEYNRWQHVTWRKTGTSLRLYVDGENVYHVNSSVPSTLNLGQNFFIGSRENWSEWFYGRIDEVKLWKTDRTESQIKNDMHTRPTDTELNSADMVGYFDFNQQSLETVYNIAKN